MVKEISNIMESTLPVLNIACGAVGAFMCRKFILAAGHGFNSKIAGLMGLQQAAQEWNKSSNEYWTLAKQDAFRDLTACAGFLTLGLVSNIAGKALLAREPKEEPGWFDNIPVLNTICEYKKCALAVTGLGILSLCTMNYRAKIFRNYRAHLITQRDNFSEEVRYNCFLDPNLRFATDKVQYLGNLFKNEPISSYMTKINKLNWWINLIKPEKTLFDIKYEMIKDFDKPIIYNL